MSKFVVIVFPTEAKAYEATRALQELHAEGSLTLYGMAVIAKDAEGHFGVKQTADEGPLGTAVGALVGGLIGLVGGPAGVLVGMTGGTLVGSMTDLFNYGVGEDFIWKVSKTMLEAGKTAVVAEVTENWTTPLDTRMEALGGTVMRTWRADFEDEQIAKELAARRAELQELQAEYAQANADAKARLKAKLDQAKSDINQAEKRLQTRLETIETELNAKIAELEKQRAAAQAEAKQKINQRIAALRADFETRSGKLKQAWALTREALAA
ncbi:DUF1269 domain-containing protein [Mesorhizobium sp. M2A.F.Ca.ET.042.01.1.1]|uniref:DUF1269 domain-containing protein n=1 Tax=Mesorhizobium sp. M2A.F.Ca.ET.042.01.1.1 TaxID=2496745 RepID=UPI000FCCC5D4|nr:DUF1269 domain-containing protein [Mesorhizobium sp. M2A.F.Ca.ET.042.01.1.1]RUX19045.1 DUF1269 domain-containing protein [Mesorhizobium sp. M2A.F.Ca.ET.042.01.1.1]